MMGNGGTSSTSREHYPPSSESIGNTNNAAVCRNDDWQALRSYVTASDAARLVNLPAGTLLLDLTHSNLQQRHIEIRFEKCDPLQLLRDRIHRKTGTPATFQHLQVMESNHVIAEIPPHAADHLKLGYFGIEHHGMRIHCVDLNPHSQSAGGALENVNLVQKYVMSEEEYDQRPGTVRAWKRQQKQENDFDDDDGHSKSTSDTTSRSGSAAKGLFRKKQDDTGDKGEDGLHSVIGIAIGDRCQLEPGQRRGYVAWTGQLSDLPGWWIGVVLDEPVGSNDGSWKGVSVFETPGPKYGAFVRAGNVAVGDFPELDLFDDSDEDEL